MVLAGGAAEHALLRRAGPVGPRDRARPVCARPASGRARLDPVGDASGVDAGRPRSALRRCGRRPDLPHAILRTSASTSSSTPTAGSSSARTLSSSRRSRRCATGARSSSTWSPSAHRRPDAISLDELRRRGELVDRRSWTGSPPGRAPRIPRRSSTPPARPGRRRDASPPTGT